MPLCPVDGAPGDQGQEERPEATERAGGAAAPKQDGEDARDLEQQASERDLCECCENVLSSPQLQKCKSTRSVSMSRAGAGVERASQARDAQMPTWGDQRLRRVFPSLELIGYFWSRAPEASDSPQDEVAGEDPPDGVRTLSPVLCGRCSVDGCLFGHLCQAKGDNERNRAVLAKELHAVGYTRVVVHSDGELALLAHVRAARAMTVESVHEQVSMGQSPGNGLAEGAVKEFKAKIRTLSHSAEIGLGSRIPETHDSLTWPVTHAAATFDWFRPGLHGKTPYELRVGRKFRRPVAPWWQNAWWMSAEKHVSFHQR